MGFLHSNLAWMHWALGMFFGHGAEQEFISPAQSLRGTAQAKYNLNNLQESCVVLLSAAVFENCLQS